MKRILIYLLTVSMILCGCTPASQNNAPDSSETGSKQTDAISIVATIFPQYDFLRAIAGDRANIKLLIPPGTESHTYEPSPSDMVSVAECDLFVYAGGKSDSWVEKILKSTERTPDSTIALTDIIPLVEEEHTEGMQEEHEHNDGKAEYDEHVWTSPANAVKICEFLCEALCRIDAGNAPYYRDGCENYISEIKKIDDEIKSIISNSKRKTIIFADRFPIRYFTEEYGLKYYAAFPGCADEIEPSPQTLVFLIDKVRNDKIPYVFYREFSNEKVADLVCESTNAGKLLFHSCHNVSADDFKSGVTYVDIMKNNAKNLKEALN